MNFSPFRIYNEEITVIGSMAVLNSYAPALALIADRTINVAPVLTHNLPLAQYPEAFEALRRGEGLKIQLSPGAVTA